MMLSIIVPALNEAETIADCLSALGPSRARGAEVIVVDGASDDGTIERAIPHADRVIGATRGRASQMNAGAAVARGAVLLFLHADTVLPADADRLIANALAGGQRQWGRFNIRIAGRPPLLRVVALGTNLRSRLTGIATGDQAIFVSRTAFGAVGGYPPLPLMEDVALTAALRRLERPACIAERATTSGRRWEKNGVIRTIALMWRLRLAYWFGADPHKLALQYHDAPGKP